MRIRESSDQAPGQIQSDVGPPILEPSSNSLDTTLPTEAPLSYSAVSPTNSAPRMSSVTVDFEAHHPTPGAQAGNTQPSNDLAHTAAGPVPRRVLDILDQIPNLFRLLDLVEDRSSGGIVEKIVIDQKSLSKVINILQPGSYKSVSNIDFKALDNLTIKPIGVYGNQLEILNYLQELGCLDPESKQLILKRNSKGEQISALRSGLYLTMSRDSRSQGASKTGFIVYWPEEGTWNDQAASLSSTIRRNRETFMRYLTKLSEQTVALVSPSQASGFVWETSSRNCTIPEHQRNAIAESRLAEFEVQEKNEQNEDAIASPGFKLSAESLFHTGNDRDPSDARLVPGEETVALLTRKMEDARTEIRTFEGPISQMDLRALIRAKEGQPQLALGEISPDSLQILSSNGLRERYPDIFQNYDKGCEGLKNTLDLTERDEKSRVDEALIQDKPLIAEVIRELVHWEYVRLYPSISPPRPESTLGLETGDVIRARYYESGLDKVEKYIQEHKVARIRNPEFRTMKSNWLYLMNRLDEISEQSETEKEDLINKITGEGLEHPEGASSSRGGLVGQFARYFLGKVGLTKDEGITKPRQKISDPDFVLQLPQWEKEYPSLAQLAQPIRNSLSKDMNDLLNTALERYLDVIIDQEQKARYQDLNRARKSAFQDQMLGVFASLLQSLKQSMNIPQQTSNPYILHIDSITSGRHQNSRSSRNNNTWFFCRGSKHIQISAQINYSVYPLGLTEHDRHQCQINEDHVPKPMIASMQRFSFVLAAASQSIEFIQIVKNKCLLIVSDSEQEYTRIFMEDNVNLQQATQSKGKITLYHKEQGGSKFCFAFDQSTRFLAVVHGENTSKVSIFEFNERFSDLRRNATIDLTEWYDEPPEISGACFQTGQPELCLIESSGRIRILSLVSRLICGAPLEIDRPIVDLFPAADGSCLLVVVAGDESSYPDRLLAFHWESFGSNQQGIEAAEIPHSDTHRVGTRFYGRGRIHIISFTPSDSILSSIALQVKQKATQFICSSMNNGPNKESGIQTVNNSLIDCHLEVWTRFPVVPAVTRDTLLSVSRQPRRLIFVSPKALPEAVSYFARMISTFRATTNKPIGENLVETIVSSNSSAKLESFDNISEFKLGSYFVELICLIPLHLAITWEEKFMPLKDGVWNPDYESSLAGATIPEVKDSLSLGWYESIFGSYMAKKLVRVVSSMGEQSVGKSYCLNHFADTSFAGSAMRTTEGVWLSCTPTKDYLLVSLDFEGMQSIERSPQEDMLLVLFNTAISNLVLFRNNFSLSRNIRGLFMSFQSSTKTFDPSKNRDLFNSTLAIIIKDVKDADTNGIQKEFSLKFNEIVQMERGQNFLTQLHRGKYLIIPWPVIDSPEFYSLFNAVRNKLELQQFTHGTGGAFLNKMKSVMVDIKTWNWTASDQSQASLRAHQLKERLISALTYGKTAEGPLKNMDTDEDVPTLDTDEDVPTLDTDRDVPTLDSEMVLFVPETGSQEEGATQEQSGEIGCDAGEKEEETAEKILKALINRCEPSRSSRPYMKESEYVEVLQQNLNYSVNRRLSSVDKWIKSNTGHFTVPNPDLQALKESFKIVSKKMLAAVKLCLASCSECKLLCLRSHRHSEPHLCDTNHACVFDCEVIKGHEKQPACGLQAGHEGKHICDVRTHSCGKDCSLTHLKGCTGACNEPLDHEGKCMCTVSARLHLCGKACDLRDASRGPGKEPYTCNSTCCAPGDEEHAQHLCDYAQRGCPIKCVLCDEKGVTTDCASPDHLHGADSNAIHLCRSTHDCPKLCDYEKNGVKGMCAIDRVASSKTKGTFSGTYERSFVYDHFTQVAKRLPCKVQIPAGQDSHDGAHVHDLQGMSHFCNVRCPGCDYFCTKELGHQDKKHSTSHGSMVGTKWIVEPHQDKSGKLVNLAYKLDNHKYGSGDDGTSMLCQMMCSQQGRHAHVDFCRNPQNHVTPVACEHIAIRMQPEPDKPKDWISHATYWERTGFEDPYGPSERSEFAKCDALCAGPEHKDDDKPSRCTLPIFHAAQNQTPPPTRGYVSPDGHLFHCINPAKAHQSYHVVFVIDSSGSMSCNDHQPLSNHALTRRLVQQCNNRYGAVVAALYNFLTDQEARRSKAGLQSRQDAYSIVVFDDKAEIRVQNNLTSTTNQLIDTLIPHKSPGYGGTCFSTALEMTQQCIEKSWHADRAPMIVFLSDGEDTIDRRKVEDLCKRCTSHGLALAFYSISFGRDSSSSSLRLMADVAESVFRSAPMTTRGAMRGPDVPCKYSTAIDSVALADTFMSISKSLPRSRAAVFSKGGVSARF